MKVVTPFVWGKLRPETNAMGEAVGAVFADVTGDVGA